MLKNQVPVCDLDAYLSLLVANHHDTMMLKHIFKSLALEQLLLHFIINEWLF